LRYEGRHRAASSGTSAAPTSSCRAILAINQFAVEINNFDESRRWLAETDMRVSLTGEAQKAC
jgi:hypothetical protein